MRRNYLVKDFCEVDLERVQTEAKLGKELPSSMEGGFFEI